ncbi:MAG: ATP synthase F1 subunit gamma [bacterium]|nr:ATP synthase F1 subunit gamma [bacterium]
MASARDIKRRVKSVRNISQITKAMQMVSASRLKKAQDNASKTLSYSKKLNEILANTKNASSDLSHPYLILKSSEKKLVILITPDRGLVGSLISNVRKLVFKNKDSDFVCIGKKGAQFLKRLNLNVIAEFENLESKTSEFKLSVLINLINQKYSDENYSNISVIYTDFISTAVQKAKYLPLLPIESIDNNLINQEEEKSINKNPYKFEPSANVIFDFLMPHFIETQLQQFLFESLASEHSARMIAMKNATDNAKKLASRLALEYNKERQASITNQILEVASGAISSN